MKNVLSLTLLCHAICLKYVQETKCEGAHLGHKRLTGSVEQSCLKVTELCIRAMVGMLMDYI